MQTIRIKSSMSDTSINLNTKYFKHVLCLMFVLVSIYFIFGCSICIPCKNGTTHHLIIGIGMVSINESIDSAIIITDVNAIGLTVTDRPGLKFGLGYTSSLVMAVPDNALDVRAEISKKIFRPILINISRTLLENYTTQNNRR